MGNVLIKIKIKNDEKKKKKGEKKEKKRKKWVDRFTKVFISAYLRSCLAFTDAAILHVCWLSEVSPNAAVESGHRKHTTKVD